MITMGDKHRSSRMEHEQMVDDTITNRELITKLLHQMARDRARSAKWDTYSLVLICGVLVAVVFLNAMSVNMIVTLIRHQK